MSRSHNVSKPYAFEETGDSYLATVSDLMAGLLFIFIITLMVFALNLKVEEVKKKKTVEELTNNNKIRSELLSNIEHSLKEKGVQITVDLENGILRLHEGILFASGRATIGSKGENTLIRLAEALNNLLPCYTGSVKVVKPKDCEIWEPGKVDIIFIEGHTDDIRMRSGARFEDNWDLSSKRATETFKFITKSYPLLDELQNSRGQPLFGVSGYEARRPVDKDNTDEARSRNRRIDLRFIMTPPGISNLVFNNIEQQINDVK